MLNSTKAAGIVGLIVGGAGGFAAMFVTHGTGLAWLFTGAVYGAVFGCLFARRCVRPGAGIVWGLGYAFLLWIAIPVTLVPLMRGEMAAMGMLESARFHFQDLVAYVTCFGAPLGLAMSFRASPHQFSLSRALTVGVFAGAIAGIVFGRWMSAGGYYPLIAGLFTTESNSGGEGLHFAVAILLACAFGLLFQGDIRGIGSSMGWGAGYGILFWFIGPLTLWPLIGGNSIDWSSTSGANLFGALVGYILYGLIVGLVYGAVDRMWVRFFSESDPINREPEGPGVRIWNSI